MGSRYVRPLCMWPVSRPRIIWSTCVHSQSFEVGCNPCTIWWWCDPLAGVYGGYSSRKMKRTHDSLSLPVGWCAAMLSLNSPSFILVIKINSIPPVIKYTFSSDGKSRDTVSSWDCIFTVLGFNHNNNNNNNNNPRDLYYRGWNFKKNNNYNNNKNLKN